MCACIFPSTLVVLCSMTLHVGAR